MTNLTTKEQSVINQLPLNYQEFVKCRLEPPVKNLSQNELKRGLADILSQSAFDMGSPMANEAQVLKFQTEACFNELSGKFGILTLSEVRNAFRKGIRGEFGPYFGMCPKTYHQFIKSYFELPDRGKAQIEYLNLIQGLEVTETPVHIQQMISIEGSKRRFKEYKETGDLGYMPFACYNVLKDLIGVEIEHPKQGKVKTLIPEPEHRRKLFNEAKAEFTRTTNTGIAKAKFSGRKKDAEDMELLLKTFDTQPTFESLLKKKYLKFYFDTLIEKGEDLEIKLKELNNK